MEFVPHLPPKQTEHSQRALKELIQIQEAFQEFFDLYEEVYPVL